VVVVLASVLRGLIRALAGDRDRRFDPGEREAGVRVLKVVGLCGVVGCVGGWAVGPALADGSDPGYPGSVLHVRVSGPLTPGSLMTVTAFGSNVQPAHSLGPYPFILNLFLQNTDMLPVPCSTGLNGENDILANNSGAVKSLGGLLNEGDSGPFTISLPVRLNNGTGHLQICAYSVYAYSDGAAWGSTKVTITAGTTAPIPANQFASRRVTLGATSGCWPLATTARERQQGLMGVRHPPRPMVFSFQQAGSYQFSMRNVPAAANGVWIGRARTVIGHWHGAPSSTATHSPPAPITAVVLYPVGWPVPADGARLRIGSYCSSNAGL